MEMLPYGRSVGISNKKTRSSSRKGHFRLLSLTLVISLVAAGNDNYT
jgi:hypothetical protein